MFVRFDGKKIPLPHNPFKACVVPRPIGWISTLDAAGVPNLAPFSFFNAVSERPPMVMYCANGEHIEGGEKDSTRNARETGEFVANLATWDLREAVNLSSKRVARTIDEFALTGLETVASTLVRPPRVAATPIALECRVVAVNELPGDGLGLWRDQSHGDRTGARHSYCRSSARRWSRLDCAPASDRPPGLSRVRGGRERV